MGAGRRTETHLGSNPPFLAGSPAGPAASGQFLLLRPQNLASVIFGCTHATFKECIQQLIFGLPFQHFQYVENVQPGMPLFLFNYSDRKLHGIFEATCPGELNINPYGWSHDGVGKTPFPAQVRVRVRQQCHPLPENVFKTAIAENYYKDNHFYFELTTIQTNALLALFQGSPATLGEMPSITVQKRSKKQGKQQHEEEDGWCKPRRTSKAAIFDAWHQAEPFIPPTYADHQSDEMEPTASDFDLESTSRIGWEEPDGLQQQSSDMTFQEVKQQPKIQNTTEEGGLESSSTFPEWERLERERCFQEQELLREERERLKESLKHVDSSVAKAIQKNLELCANALAQMRQDRLELKNVLHEASMELGALRELDKLREKNAMLEHSQVQMCSELEILKLDMDRMSKQLEALSQGNRFVTVAASTEAEVCEEELDFKASSHKVYLLGGHNGEMWLDNVDVYCPTTHELHSVLPMLNPRSYAAASVLMGQVYIFGGGNGRIWYDTVEIYDRMRDEWFYGPPMSLKRGSLAGATVGDRIYAVGGGNGQISFSDVECYDAHLGMWISSTSMLNKRFGVTATELEGALYAMGGYDGVKYLTSVERFDPRQALWTSVAQMNSKRGSFSVATLGGKIYAIGGYDGKDFLNSVEYYEPRTNSWLELESKMVTRRAYGSAAVVDDTLFMFGGFNGGPYIDMVECYNEKSSWSVVESAQLGRRCFLASVVLA